MEIVPIYDSPYFFDEYESNIEEETYLEKAYEEETDEELQHRIEWYKKQVDWC